MTTLLTDVVTLKPNLEFTRLASDAQVSRAARALEANGMHTILLESGKQARSLVMDLIPAGATVYDPPSRTLLEIGLAADFETESDFHPLRTRLSTLDRNTQQSEIRRLSSSPDVVVGSVHAVTELGQVMIASASGSQLSSTVFGAGQVVWVVGTQKIVPTLDEGFRRIREYCYPLENERAQQAYGRPSAINKILIVNGERPGRITVVLVRQNLGF